MAFVTTRGVTSRYGRDGRARPGTPSTSQRPMKRARRDEVITTMGDGVGTRIQVMIK